MRKFLIFSFLFVFFATPVIGKKIIYQESGSNISDTDFHKIYDAIQAQIDASTDSPVEQLTLYEYHPESDRLDITYRVCDLPDFEAVIVERDQMKTAFDQLNQTYSTDFPNPKKVIRTVPGDC